MTAISKPKKWLLIVFLCISFVTVSAQKYYVAENGNDNNPGTEAEPWKTLNKANNFSFQSGDDLYLNRGDTFRNTVLKIQWEGTSNNKSFIGAYGSGNKPVIKFDDQPGNGIFTYGSKYLVIENIEMINAGISLGGAGSKDYTIRNVKVTNPQSQGIILTHVNGYLIENCEITKAGNGGIAVWGSALPQAQNGIIRNNTVSHGRSNDGIVIHRKSNGADVGPNHLILNNTSHHNPEQGFDITAGSYVLIQGNTSYENKGGGIAIGHAVDHIVIDQHTSTHEGNWTASIFFTGSDDHGGDDNSYMTVRRSLIIDPTTFGINAYRDTRNIAIANNTIFQSRTPIKNRSMISFKDNAKNITVKNNIVVSTINQPDYFVSTPNNSNSKFDANYYFRTDLKQKLFNGHTFSDWQSSEGQDEHGKYIDPLLKNPSAQDFTLKSNSPAINAGAPVTYTISSGSGTKVKVGIAYFFFDGFGLMDGDNISIGNNAPVKVLKVDYESNTITIDKSISWGSGDGVSLPYNGSAPDIGAFESGSTLATNEFDTNSIAIQIYPNPAVNEINIHFTENQNVESISIYDVLGKRVFTKKIEASESKITLNPNLSKGVYFLKIESDKGMLSEKIIIK